MIHIKAVVRGTLDGVFDTDEHDRAKEILKEMLIKKGFTDVTIMSSKSEVVNEPPKHFRYV